MAETRSARPRCVWDNMQNTALGMVSGELGVEHSSAMPGPACRCVAREPPPRKRSRRDTGRAAMARARRHRQGHGEAQRQYAWRRRRLAQQACTRASTAVTSMPPATASRPQDRLSAGAAIATPRQGLTARPRRSSRPASPRPRGMSETPPARRDNQPISPLGRRLPPRCALRRGGEEERRPKRQKPIVRCSGTQI